MGQERPAWAAISARLAFPPQGGRWPEGPDEGAEGRTDHHPPWTPSSVSLTADSFPLRGGSRVGRGPTWHVSPQGRPLGTAPEKSESVSAYLPARIIRRAAHRPIPPKEVKDHCHPVGESSEIFAAARFLLASGSFSFLLRSRRRTLFIERREPENNTILHYITR